MPEVFDCPSCGASLELDSDNDGLVRCQHCGKNVVVPESLRRKPEPSHPMQPEVQVLTLQTPINWQTPKQNGAGRFLSCFLIAVVLLIIGTTVLSIAAPLVVTGLMAKVVGDNTSFLQGMLTTEVASQNPQINITMPVLADFMETLTPQAPAPGFAEQVLSFGAQGTGPGRFDDTRSIAVDSDGFIYTAEYSDHRIQKFSPEGKYVLGWTADGSNPLMSMAVSRAGVVYVVTTGEIYKYDTQGNSIGQVARPNDDYIEAVTITADNGLLAASNDAIYRFDSDEQLIFQIEKPYQPASDSGSVVGGVAVDGLGNIYAPIQYVQQSKFKTSIFIFTPQGEYSNRFGGEGDQPGQFRALQTVVLDGAGRIYVSDFKGIQVFSPDGAYLSSIDLEGVAFGMWFDDAGALYVASNANKILKYEILE